MSIELKPVLRCDLLAVECFFLLLSWTKRWGFFLHSLILIFFPAPPSPYNFTPIVRLIKVWNKSRLRKHPTPVAVCQRDAPNFPPSSHPSQKSINHKAFIDWDNPGITSARWENSVSAKGVTNYMDSDQSPQFPGDRLLKKGERMKKKNTLIHRARSI